MLALRHFARALLALLLCSLLLLASVAVVGALQKPNTKIPADLAGTHVDVRGLPLRVLQRGTGRDVLFIHGSPGSLEDWSPLFESLAGAFRLTAYDRPGHGYSGDAGRYSYQFNADTALALIDALKLQHVIVVGHSYGGPIALAMALRAPAAVDAYVTLDSSYFRPRAPQPSYRLIAIPWLGMGVAALASASIAPSKIRAGLQRVFGARNPPESFVAERTRIWSCAKVTHALALESLHAADELAALSPRYPSIHAPLYIVAEADDPRRVAGAKHLQRDVIGAQLRLLPDTGHYLQIEKPVEVAEVIRTAAAATAR
jgi:pimeloyl-ACP methyl ester carboxylesterase